MARKKLVDHNALVQAIEMEMPQKEVMEKFGYKTSTQLKVAYTNALIALEKIPGIVSKRSEKKLNTVVKVNARGSLGIPKALVENFGFSPKDRFDVRKSKSGFSLRLIENSPKTIVRKKSSVGTE